jgi:hypothetical protein
VQRVFRKVKKEKRGDNGEEPYRHNEEVVYKKRRKEKHAR